MADATEHLLPRPKFTDRHPRLADQVDNFPQRIGIAIGAHNVKEYPAIFQTAFSLVHELSDSPAQSLDLIIDPLIGPEDEIVRSYLSSFLEGAVSRKVGSFNRDGVRVNWVGPTDEFSSNAKARIENAVFQTQANPGIELNIVTDLEAYNRKPNLLIASDRTPEDFKVGIIGESGRIASAGESITQVNNATLENMLVPQAEA